MLCSVCLLIQFLMECNREELQFTAGGGPPEEAPFSAKKKSSPEARAERHPQSESQGPIVAESWHRASLSDSAHEFPGIFSSLPSSKRPISRSVFPRTNRLLQALAGSRKSCREWGLFAPAPAGWISSIFFSRAPHPPPRRNWFSLAWCFVLALNSQTTPAPPQSAASGPGRSLFGVA